jgi:hypothetical protein
VPFPGERIGVIDRVVVVDADEADVRGMGLAQPGQAQLQRHRLL